MCDIHILSHKVRSCKYGTVFTVQRECVRDTVAVTLLTYRRTQTMYRYVVVCVRAPLPVNVD
jgi:hypothetical protein